MLSGDWHTHWVNDLKTDFADPAAPTVATEFVGTSISSGAGWNADVRAGRWHGTRRGGQADPGRPAVAASRATCRHRPDDPQLAGVTVGKPLDLAAVGHLDQLDWINLPYASAIQPRGGNAWQQRTVRSTAVDVLAAGGDAAAVRATGASTAVPEIEVVTTYTVRAGEPWVTAESSFTNRGAVPRTVWVGDALDHDGAGQRSGVAGHGTITSGTPTDYPPAAPWIGMTGSDRQTYGLIYEDTAFVGYGVFNWVMSQRQLTIVPGETFTLRRRVVAIGNGGAADPFAVLGEVS